MSIVTRDTFTGSNNIAKPERLPEGAVVDALNMDFTVGGKAELRTGFVKIRAGQDVRALYDFRGALVVADGPNLVKLTGSGETNLATLSAGPISATMHNEKLYLNTLAESLVIGDTVEPWAVDEPAFDVTLVAGNAEPGVYKIGVTRVVAGRESGCWPAVVNVGEGQSISVSTSGGSDLRLYSSVANGQTMYYQGAAYPVSNIYSPVDNTERLETAFLTSMPFCENLISHEAMIIGSSGRILYHSVPMHPHLHDGESGYIQFPSDITIVIPSPNGVYVCADKTYFIERIGGEVEQRAVAEFGGIAGTALQLPDGTATWFSKYGQVIGGKDGVVEFHTKDSYSPYIAERGAAGFLEHNGNQMIVTTMRGEQKGSSLKSVDHWDIEVI